MKPILLLDIDGVVNPVAADAWPDDQWVNTSAIAADERKWSLLGARPVLDFLTDVHGKDRADIRWHSTWQHRSNAVGDALGLPRFGVADAPEFNEPRRHAQGDWWKLPAVLRAAAEGRPLVWVDDDASSWEFPSSVRAEVAAACPFLLVVPTTLAGLTREHLDLIGAFLDAQNGAL